MFSQILVSTDGSKLSERAIRTALRLANSTRANVCCVYVIPPYVPPSGEAAIYIAGLTAKRYGQEMQRAARRALSTLPAMARTAGVACKTMKVTADSPWEGVLLAARRTKSDLIVMASHGRRGLSGFILGSETNKVLTHSKIPVLVCR